MEKLPTFAHELSVDQISELLTSAKLDATKCILMHPTKDTVLSFDMLSGNKRFMFSDGHSYFTEVLKSLSLNRVIESTMVRSFFDCYTAKEALSDWKKMDNETRSLFQKDSSPIGLYRLFISDIKRMMKGAVEKTMCSVQAMCDLAQRTLIQALHFQAVLNMIPSKPVIQQQGGSIDNQSCPLSSPPTSGYAYEHRIAQSCIETGSNVRMTRFVPAQEDTIVIFNTVTKEALGFLYEEGKLSQLEVVFLGAVSHETLTRRQDQPLVRTHSLCETVIHLERYLHEMESTHMKVMKDLAFRSTVIIQDAEDCDEHLAKKRKADKYDSTGDGSLDPYVVQSLKEYNKGMNEHLLAAHRATKEITNGSRFADQVPLTGRNVSDAELRTNTSVDVLGNIVTEEGTNVMGLVRDLQSQQAPLGGRSLESSLAYIESGTNKLNKEFIRQQQNLLSLKRALTFAEKTHSVLLQRNTELFQNLVKSRKSCDDEKNRLLEVQADLDSAQSSLRHIRSTMHVPEENTSSTGDHCTTGLRQNVLVDEANQDDYNTDFTPPNGTGSIRYVNLSDSTDKKLRYLNANFSIPPLDRNLRDTARKVWESEVKSRFFLRDHVFSSTGNPIERQPSYDTTAVYLGGFCKQFMNFYMKGRVVFDSIFMSKTDTVEHIFACESEGTAIDMMNEMQSLVS